MMGYRGKCPMCGTNLSVENREWHRELGRCVGCGLNARLRGVIVALSLEIYGDLACPLIERDMRKDVRVLGISDNEEYATLLTSKFEYLNTFFHREPYLDICDIECCARYQENRVVICSDVIEHSRLGPMAVIRNQLTMLAQGGVIILSAPTFEMDDSIEWYGALRSYSVEGNGDRPRLRWVNLRGQEFLDPDPIFHGGAGAAVELRLLSHGQVLAIAPYLGAEARTLEFDPCWGYSWPLVPQFSYLDAPVDGRVIVIRKRP
jgi:hypothetical protein